MNCEGCCSIPWATTCALYKLHVQPKRRKDDFLCLSWKKTKTNQTKLSLKFQSIGVGTVPTLENEKKKIILNRQQTKIALKPVHRIADALERPSVALHPEQPHHAQLKRIAMASYTGYMTLMYRWANTFLTRSTWLIQPAKLCCYQSVLTRH